MSRASGGDLRQAIAAASKPTSHPHTSSKKDKKLEKMLLKLQKNIGAVTKSSTTVATSSYESCVTLNSSKGGSKTVVGGVRVSEEEKRRRRERFSAFLATEKAVTPSSTIVTNLHLRKKGKNRKVDVTKVKDCLIGTCQVIEKSFLRLTREPLPSEVRPLNILRLALSTVQERWLSHGDYAWCCEQLKSIRQDLLVQGETGTFSLEVYEVHARLALENGDLEEFNQCQDRLRVLFDNFISNIHTIDTSSEFMNALENKMSEFCAYDVLYNLVVDGSAREVCAPLLHIPTRILNSFAVKHALKCVDAFRCQNYVSFFRLLESCPNMGAYILDLLVDRVRRHALRCICSAVRPAIAISSLTSTLAFENDRVTEHFLIENFATICRMNGGDLAVDTKTTWQRLTGSSVAAPSAVTGRSSLATSHQFTNSRHADDDSKQSKRKKHQEKDTKKHKKRRR